jgi:hypothetical protein
MDGSSDTDARGVMDIFDEVEGGLACRVCGALVPATGSYGQIHLDWHEATNGA